MNRNNKQLYESIMKDVSKIIKQHLNETYISWTKALSGCYAIPVSSREIAIVPRKGDFPKSFNADSRHNILKRCGFTNIKLIDRNINGQTWCYLEATKPRYWPDYEEIKSIEDVIKNDITKIRI